MFCQTNIVIGPLAAAATHSLLNILQPRLTVPPLDPETTEDGEGPGLVCLCLMLVIYITTFTLSMVVAELVPSIYTQPFLLVMVKYVLGTLHHSLVPVVIIFTRPDLRDLIMVI